MSIVSDQSLPPATAASPAVKANHLAGLDSIRIVCAMWVVIGHLGSPFNSIANKSHIWHLAASATGPLFCGPAAVIVFFVISGLCIHFPYRNGAPVNYFAYYIRRYIRIGIPMAAALAISMMTTTGKLHLVTLSSFNNSVLWSLIAEIIYYTIYPGLMWAKKTLGWPTVIGMSFIAAYGVILTHHAAEISGYYGIFGWKLNWVVGLPCWLLGCLLAERLPQDQKINIPQLPTAAKIWTWRAAVFAASVVALVLQFHQHSQRFHLGYSFTLDFFAVLVYFWLQKETHYCRFNRPFRWLEAAGAASYSLYLTHPIVIDYFLLHQRWASKSVAGWMCIMCEIIVAAMVFYLVVERPSHMAARSFRQQRTEKIAAKTSPAVTL